MEFDFEIMHRLGLYYRTADNTISRLPKGDDSSQCNERDVSGDTPTYCIMGQNSPLSSTIGDNYSTALAMPTPNKIFGSQQTYTYCQYMPKMVGGSDTRFTMDENGLICRNGPLDGSLQIIVLKGLRQAVLYNDHPPTTTGHSGT